jgi:putative FmdB family regulatory protein
LPLYEYRCRKCGAIIEQIQKFTDEPLRECSKCGGELERLISAPAIQFKGSGWYITDYARKTSSAEGAPAASGATESTSKPADSPSASRDSKKSESSPAAKS